ncbi:MAG: hypothetical protein HC888_13060 [Candidatus Competibacteraceae bacterium]|nr:hypothetical protein [Candidatus Competibacteraceae bacterium]
MAILAENERVTREEASGEGSYAAGREHPRIPGTRRADGRLYLGEISLLHFDRVIIRSIAGVNVRVGTKFFIMKGGDQQHDAILGSGKIVELSGDLISGRLESLTDTANRPEIGDIAFVGP